jgi:maltokinase
MTAELHLALADAFGAEAGDSRAWAATLARRIGEVHHPDLDTRAAAEAMARLAGVADPGNAIRIHGDYHLGQVLRTDEGWFVVDFEGEPLRGPDERLARSSPLQDVAGMLRSFDYAAHVALAEHGGERAERAELAELAEAWEQHNRSAFVDAYSERVRGHGLVPSDTTSFATVLGAYEIDKAVYEVAYEQAHRPDWVGVPLAGVRRLVGERS